MPQPIQPVYSLPRWRLTKWLAEPGTDVAEQIQSALVNSLFGSLPIFISGILNTLTIALVCAFREHSAPFIAWFIVETILCCARIAVLVWANRAAAVGRATPTDLHMILALCWAGSVGYGAFLGLVAGDWVVATITCLSAAAMVGGICFRNFGAPRYVCAMIVLALGPVCPGAFLSGEPITLTAFFQIPMYAFAMTAAAFQLNQMLVSTMRSERENAQKAQQDALTGLVNRTLFLECVKDAAQLAAASFAVHIIDLDEFKAINDTFGHAVGDALLKAVAVRLGELTGPSDVVARLGGDEFAILQWLMSPDIGPATALAERLLTHIREPYQIEDREVKIGLSIGIATDAGAALEPSAIMRNADLALYRAKADGRNCLRLFDPAMAEEIQSRRELAMALDAALAQGQLAVHYQPIVDAATLNTNAMEALARWRHPMRGNIAPGIFIPLAEEAGLIVRLGAFVLETACRDALAWPPTVKVSVNVSPIQVTRSDLVAVVKQTLAKTGLPPQRLQIEITESVLLGDEDHNLAVLRELRDTGIAIVLDDFGTGYSSLNYLNHFPLDKIKIDHSFVERLGVDAGSAAIVAAVTNIARAHDAITTAEGVETEEQYRLLRLITVDEMQGYLFGVPQEAQAWDFQGRKAVTRSELSQRLSRPEEGA